MNSLIFTLAFLTSLLLVIQINGKKIKIVSNTNHTLYDSNYLNDYYLYSDAEGEGGDATLDRGTGEYDSQQGEAANIKVQNKFKTRSRLNNKINKKYETYVDYQYYTDAEAEGGDATLDRGTGEYDYQQGEAANIKVQNKFRNRLDLQAANKTFIRTNKNITSWN